MRTVMGSVLVLAALAACAPTDPAVRLAQQSALCENGVALAEQRIEACSAVIAASADDPARRAGALVQRGMLRVDTSQDARAVADFGRALRIDPNLTSAYIERASLHFDRSAFDYAVRDYDAALAISPDHPVALQGREAALRGVAVGPRSQLDIISEALARNPNDATLWNNRCWVRAVEGEALDYALADCNEALRLEPRHAAALDSRGLVHLKRGDYAAAIADYDAALALDPNRGHYLFGRGVARLRMGNTSAARADFAAAEREEPGIASVYRSYGITI